MDENAREGGVSARSRERAAASVRARDGGGAATFEKAF